MHTKLIHTTIIHNTSKFYCSKHTVSVKFVELFCICRPTRHRLMRFSAKCSERKCLHGNGQCHYMAIKYYLFCSWEVASELFDNRISSKIFQVNKVRANPAFQNQQKRCSTCPPRERITYDGTLINKQFSTVKGGIFIV